MSPRANLLPAPEAPAQNDNDTPKAMRRFRRLLEPALAEGRAYWGSEYFEDAPPESAARVADIVRRVFEDATIQDEVDRFIELQGSVDTTAIESIYLDAAVKFYLASPAMQGMFREWHAQLPVEGIIIHYGTSSGTESAWLLHEAPSRTVLQVDSNDAAFDSGQKKLVRVSQGRATDYHAIKRAPWRPTMLEQKGFADGAIIHRVPPFPLENRTRMLQRAYEELKPGARLVLVEPNLESGGNPDELAAFIEEIANASVNAPSQLTEFDLALVARVKARCLSEPDFHLFRAQMDSYFLTYSEAITLAESIGFRVRGSTAALHGRVFHLVLEKPTGDGALWVATEPAVKSKNFVTEEVPRRHELRHDVKDRAHYKRLAVGQMLTTRYGLQQVSFLTADMTNFDAHHVFAVRTKKNELAAMARLIPFYETRKFFGLSVDVRRELLQARVMCMSIYYEDIIRGTSARELEAVAASLACCLRLHDAGRLDQIYAEVRADQESTYEKLGFERIGDAFTVEGWSNTFCPVRLDLSRLEHQAAHIPFLARVLKLAR